MLGHPIDIPASDTPENVIGGVLAEPRNDGQQLCRLAAPLTRWRIAFVGAIGSGIFLRHLCSLTQAEAGRLLKIDHS